ncbi:TonB family protein [Humidesulfovibrio idahonensis]
MGISKKSLGLNRALGISAGVHLLPFVLFFTLTQIRFLSPPPKGEPLLLELAGIVSNQQTQGEQAVASRGEKQPQAAQQKAAPPAPARADDPEGVSDSTRQAVAHAAQGQQAQAREGQTQQTTGKNEQEGSRMRQYMSELGRLVNSRVRYPVKARAKGLTGVTYVAFTVSDGGGIVAGSESVHRTSGSPELDQAALSAVRNMERVPAPPHSVQVVVAINFAQSG